MWRALLWLIVLPPLTAGPSLADSVVAMRDIAKGAIVSADDVTMVAMDIPQAIASLDLALGYMATSPISAGQALRSDQVLMPVFIERNAVVTLAFRSAALEIRTEGRALTQGRAGDVIEIMNLSSRTRVLGQIAPDGTVIVAAPR
jgi:flagella basal body P-ring formation protein FlgA